MLCNTLTIVRNIIYRGSYAQFIISGCSGIVNNITKVDVTNVTCVESHLSSKNKVGQSCAPFKH